MAQIETSLEINAPISEVFDFVNDWHNVLDYMESFTKFEPVTENSSRATFIPESEVPGSFLGATADKLAVERTKGTKAQKSLEDIKRLVEGS